MFWWIGLGPTASGASSLLSRLRALSRTIILNYIYKIQSFLALAHSPTAERPNSQKHVWILWQYGSNGKRSIASGAWPSCVAFRSSISAYSYCRPPNPFIRHSSNHWYLDDPLARAHHLYLAKPPHPSWSDRSEESAAVLPASASESFRILIDGFERAWESTSTWEWELGIATSYHQVLRAQCYPPRSIHPWALQTTTAAQHDKGQATMPNLA